VIKHAWQPQLSRENDATLMESIADLNFSRSERKIINNWRLYFQVLTCADLATANGEKIEKKFCQFSSIHQSISTSTLNWPHQGQPHRSTFGVWKHFLARCVGMRSNGTLSKKLGRWLCGSSFLTQLYPYYFSSKDNTLWIRTSLGFIIHRCIWERSIILRFDKLRSAFQHNLPDHAFPIDVTIHDMWLQLSLPRFWTHSPVSWPQPAGQPPLALPAAPIDTSEVTWDTLIIDNKKDFGRFDMTTIMNSPSKIYLVSDGSLVEQQGGTLLS
jgi:hypothetical protein